MKFATNNSKPPAAEGCYKIIKMSASKSIFKYKVINYCIVLAFFGLHFNSVRAEWSSNSNKQGKSLSFITPTLLKTNALSFYVWVQD